jgi:hypothetical protein
MSEHFWIEKKMNPLRIILDPLNPRIEVPDGANQSTIRKKLIEYGKVINLANSIIKFGGLLPGERVIVCKEGNRYTVLEGNRRVCACQIILDPSLLPQKFKRSLKRVTIEIKSNIEKIKAEIAPTRDDAEPVITKRHTDVGVVTWNTKAKMRRASRLLEEGYSIDDIADKLSAQKATIKQAIREYRLYHYAINLGGWSEQELEALMDDSLQTNPFTRFFNVGGVKEKLGLHFDGNDHPKTKLSRELFDKQMKHIARSFLIPVPRNNNKPIANTRTSMDIIFARFNPDENIVADPVPGEEQADHTQENPSAQQKKQKRSKPKAASPSIFFENLICAVQNDSLIGITDEIKRIDYKLMRIAATMLLRGLLESSLDYQIRSVKKYEDMYQQLKDKNNGKSKDVGLLDLMKYCRDKKNNVFISPRIADALSHSSVSIYKEQLDIVTHGKWALADADVLVKAANALRPIISYILEGQNNEIEV